MDKKYYYITTTIPYVNADPHIGFALEIVQADCLARFHRLAGDNVFHNFGSDEHGVKIYQKAVEAGKDPQKYVDEYAEKFRNLKKALNLNYDAFIRTTNPEHIKAAQEFWKLCDKAGDIYKKSYKTKYCVGCEMEKTDSELINGFCEFHSGKSLEIIEEENYFFRFSKYGKPLLKFYKENPDFVIPTGKFNEIKTFVEAGLQDFSVSRLKSKLPWGVPVPNDPDHVMYVWFDALVNYISVLGWPKETVNYKNYWPGIQTAGKDNLRKQTAIWQAMLLSAGLPNSKQVFIHGFITSAGERMSKTIGNVVNPYDLVGKYGTDALRYYLLAKINPYDDSDFTIEKFEEVYNGELANGLGNLVSRVASLAQSLPDFKYIKPKNHTNTISKDIANEIQDYRFDEALNLIWNSIRAVDLYLSTEKPWRLDDSKPNDQHKKVEVVSSCITLLSDIADNLKPFLPDTAQKIEAQFKGPKIKSSEPLFPRLK